MATDNLQALFGGTMLPQDMQQELINQRAQQFAQLTPTQQLSQMGYKTGAAIGGGLAQAMGVDITDPKIKRMSQLQALSQGVEPTAEGLKAFAQKLAAAGFNAEAAQAMDKSISMEKEKSITTRNVREAKTTDQRNYETAQSQGYTGTLQDFILAEKRAGASKTNIGITQKQEEAVTKSNVEAFGSLRDQAIAAGRTLESVQALKPLIDKSFTGFAANQKLTAGQIADTFGIPVQGTSETERLKSIQNNLKIGNSTVLKGSLSDKDMAILGDAIGQGNTTASGLKGIISEIEKTSLIAQRQYQKANDYQQQGKLAQYDFVGGDKEARAEVNAKLKRIAELEAKAGKGK